MAKRVFQSANLKLSTGSTICTPALETRMSTPPNFATTASTPASTWASSVTFMATPMALWPVGSKAAAVALAASMFRSAMATFAPCSRKARAMSLPMPLAAPVMMATLSCRLMLDPFT